MFSKPDRFFPFFKLWGGTFKGFYSYVAIASVLILNSSASE